MRVIIIAVLIALSPTLALAANCKRNGNAVTCDDGRTGIFAGDAIIWPDGTRSSSAPASERTYRAQGLGARRPRRVRRIAVRSRLGSARRSQRAAQTRLCGARQRFLLLLNGCRNLKDPANACPHHRRGRHDRPQAAGTAGARWRPQWQRNRHPDTHGHRCAKRTRGAVCQRGADRLPIWQNPA